LDKNFGFIFLFIDEDILLLAEYGVKDKSNDLAKIILLNGNTKYDSMHVKHCETAKGMLAKLKNLYLGGKLYFLEMEKNAKDVTFITVTNHSSSNDEDERMSDSSEILSIINEGKLKIIALE